MSTSIVDLKGLHQAYTRLSEKFKTFWTFHQFLQGVHKTFFSNTPEYKVDFQGLYDEIKNLTVAMTFQPPAQVMDSINRLDDRLEQVHRTLSEDDRKISPNYVRRFFEKVRTEDEKLLLSLLRFYFYARQASHDTLDKMDFLITLVGARRSLDDGRYLPRFPVELQKLFSAFLSLTHRKTTDPAEVKVLVSELSHLEHEIDGCEKFEELTEKKVLERLRTLKHRTANEFYTVEVLSGILHANLAAKNKFQSLYEEEERRILESSRQLMEIERELERNPRYSGDELREEFKRFRQYRDDFDRQQREGGIRHQDVTRLAESIDTLLSHFESLPNGGAAEGVSVGATVPVAEAPAAAPEPIDFEPSRTAPKTETGTAAYQGTNEATLSGVGSGVPPAAAMAVPAVSRDPLLAEHASKILYSVELIDEGTGSGHAAYGKGLQRLRLEPWEVRSARRILNEELPPDTPARERDLLFFESAALRLRIDEEATWLRTNTHDPSEDASLAERLAQAGRCLVKAQELDRRFRVALDEAVTGAPPEKLNELHRSRFRLLRGFSGLWLLHNAKIQ